jgi:hypothetical protein
VEESICWNIWSKRLTVISVLWLSMRNAVRRAENNPACEDESYTESERGGTTHENQHQYPRPQLGSGIVVRRVDSEWFITHDPFSEEYEIPFSFSALSVS